LTHSNIVGGQCDKRGEGRGDGELLNEPNKMDSAKLLRKRETTGFLFYPIWRNQMTDGSEEQTLFCEEISWKKIWRSKLQISNKNYLTKIDQMFDDELKN
jgi:hypothetical protein